jgi:hypothetical protein
MFDSKLIDLVKKNKEAMELDLQEKYTQLFDNYFYEKRLVEQFSKYNKCELTLDDLPYSLKVSFIETSYNHDFFCKVFIRWFYKNFDEMFTYELGSEKYNVRILIKN